MEITSQNLPKSQVEFTVIINDQEFDNYQNQAFHKIKQKISVPGFRKGHVPDAVVKMNVSDQEIEKEAMYLAIDDAHEKALSDELSIINRPLVIIDNYNPITFKILVDVIPEIDLGNYRELKVKMEPVIVEPSDIDTEILKFQKDLQESRSVDGPCVNEDYVVINISANNLDGEDLIDMKRDDFEFEIGDKIYIPEINQEVLGLKVGDKKSFVVQLADDFYRKQYAGTKCQINIEVIEIEKNILPELNEEFVEKLTGKKNTIDNLRNDISIYIADRKKQENESTAIIKVLEQLASKITFEVPNSLVNNQIKFFIERVKNKLKPYNITWEKYLKIIESTHDKEIAKYKIQAEKMVKEHLIIEEIMDFENIKADEKDEEEIEKIMKDKMENMSRNEARKYLHKMNKDSEEYQKIEFTVLFYKTVKSFIEA